MLQGNWVRSVVLLFSMSWASGAHAEGWIDLSNKIAREFGLDDAERYPEGASALGYRQYDSQAIHLEDDMETADAAWNKKWLARLDKELAATSDANLKIDLKILRERVEQNIEGDALSQKYGEMSFYPATKTVFNSLKALINPQSGDDRKSAAVDRFKLYVNGHGKFKPLLEAYQSRILYLESQYPDHRLQPLKQEVELYLSESDDYLKGIDELLRKSGRSDWEADYEKFKKQAVAYADFVRTHVLPEARTDFRLPAEIYAHVLKRRGINSTPQDLIKTSLADYKEVYARFINVAKQVARKHKLSATDPVSVIGYLKSKQVTKSEEVKKLYEEADAVLARIIKEHQLVSLPREPLKIRIAGEAESKALPIPHLLSPPLIGNRGERPEFIVPSSSSGKLPFDDFSYEAAALILTAHEGRPGHDLQDSSMLDNGISVARAKYAFNNVNAEGWALYAEDLVFKYLPVESQLVALQSRLWRIARAFLDPQIQLGEIESKRVIELFTKELGVSNVMAELELRRYTFDNPGQAPSYHYGLKRVLAAKNAVQKKLGASFTLKCFNDALLSLGRMPIDLAGARLLETLTCSRQDHPHGPARVY